MRDLEQIQEVEVDGDLDDTSTRRLATLLMAALATVGLVFAMGILLGRTADAVDQPPADPFAALSELSAQAPEDEPLDVPEIQAEELTFPAALESYDRRPEVAAAIAAAAAELEHPEPIFDAPPALPVTTVGAAPLPASLPAAVAAGPGSAHLAQLRENDPLLQEALPEEAPPAPAAEGSDGKYTLQVASFQNPEDANSFAHELRTRSHTAFVTSAEIPDRGTFWRVRIGPFDTMGAASNYRASFEAEERMNTYIVKKRDQARP